MKYSFVTKRFNSKMPAIPTYPVFLLSETNWDDFGWKTTFELDYYSNSKRKSNIGNIKILKANTIETNLPQRFSSLSSEFCSLGQEIRFYLNLIKIFKKEEILAILESLNEISICKGLIDDFENDPGYTSSLLRSSESQKALNEGSLIINNIDVKNHFNFVFETKIDCFIGPHIIEFNFNNESVIPKRLVAFIGKNGSGKTQVLSRIASSLSGNKDSGKYNTKYLPPFSKVIAVSYSLFDNFEIPNKSKSFSYYYCGLRPHQKDIFDKQIERRIIRSINSLNSNNGLTKLGMYLEELLGREVTLRILHDDYNKISINFKIYDKNRFSVLSSGQLIIVLIISEILANIRKESLILFDEPETHLHPNAISKLINVIYKILNNYDSYAIIATHSPQIIQEIPSSSIYLFSNNENTDNVRKLNIQTFGENLSTLTENIFRTIDVDEYYKKVLTELSNNYSENDILKMFESEGNVLSLNAKIYLATLYKK